MTPSWASQNPEKLQQEGPQIRVNISAPRIDREEAETLGLEYPVLSVLCLIDTGASRTVINPQVAQTCRLRHTGFALISAAGSEPQRYPEYAAMIVFPDTNLKPIEMARVVGCPLPKQQIACLVGRDFLRKWRFVYEGVDGSFGISD